MFGEAEGKPEEFLIDEFHFSLEEAMQINKLTNQRGIWEDVSSGFTVSENLWGNCDCWRAGKEKTDLCSAVSIEYLTSDQKHIWVIWKM